MDNTQKQSGRSLAIRHRGRGAQVFIYFGKLLRMFVYQSDWKVLPMAALIAGLVGMVVRNKMFLNMEGTLMGAFAMVCVCIWNGCFNSIQVICRERDVIKREHRSGMHISSYIFSHTLYQALLCLGQSVITIYVTMQTGVRYPLEGLVTPLFVLDFAICLFLITFASDLMALWISSLAKTTTTAMTIMPFILIFQLVFSGGMLTLPQWTKPLTRFTISNPGLKALATLADTNHRPYASIASMVEKMRDSEISISFTLGEAADLLQDQDNPAIQPLRAAELDEGLTVGQVIDSDIAKVLLEDKRDEVIALHTTVGQILDIIGEERAKTFLEQKTAEANYVSDYEYTGDNLMEYWMQLILFIFVFAVLSTVTLEFIDKDRR